MRKIALFLLMVFGTVVASAAPLRSGLYVNTKVGVTRTEIKMDGDKKSNRFPFTGALGLGARIRSFRIEAEYAFWTKAKTGGYQQTAETFSGQAYYDVPFKSPIRPFFNGGVGHHDTNIRKVQAFKDRKNGMFWNVGGGVTWNLSNAVNMDLGYRYIDFGDFKTREGTVKTTNHLVYLGWRYVF